MQTKKCVTAYNYYCPNCVLTVSVPHGDEGGKKTTSLSLHREHKSQPSSAEWKICFLTCSLGLAHPLSSHWIKYRSSPVSRAVVPYLTNECPIHGATESHSCELFLAE